MSTPLGRRGLLGYVGSAVAGAAAGATAGAVGATAARDDGASVVRRAGETLSPHGPHQPGVAAPSAAVTDLVALDLRAEARTDGRDALARLLRVLSGDVEALVLGRGAPGDPTPWLAAGGADLTVTVGLGPRLLAGEGVLPAPPGWTRVPPMGHDALEARWTGGDLLLAVAGRDATTVGHAVRRLVADLAPFARTRWRQQGSWNGFDAEGRRVTGRNLFGQVDGSANPQPGTALFDRTVWVAEGPWTGGTTVVVRRIRMDLTEWDRLTRDRQERVLGRRLADGAPLTGGVEGDDVVLASLVPAAHVRRSHPASNGGARIFRKGANYETADGSEAGLLFQSYQADLGAQLVPVQRSVDRLDALNEWTVAVGSAEFAVLPGFVEGEWLGQRLLEA